MNPLLDIEEALQRVLGQIQPLGTETLPLPQLLQRVLAENVLADADVPAFDRSAMDGIALRAEDGALELQLAGESAAGSPFLGQLLPGQYVRVMTGGVVPNAANAVVPVERLEKLADQKVRILDAVRPEQHIARQGSEIRAGAVVLRAGQRLTAARLGVLATYGRAQALVSRQPQVAMVPTGNEIVPVQSQPKLGQVRDANRHALTGLMQAMGAQVTQHPVALDEKNALKLALQTAWEKADVLVTSGGVSAGDYDLVPPVLQELGATAHFHQIAIKPGKPLLFATREHQGKRQFAFGLPGNPVSSYVCCLLFVLPALAALQGQTATWQTLNLPVLRALPKTGPRAEMLPARLVQTAEGTRVEVSLLSSSADLTRFAEADWLAWRPAHASTLEAGQPVTLMSWPRP